MNNEMPSILVDIDDVLIDLVDAWVKRLNEKHGTNVKPEYITEWDIDQFFPYLYTSEVYAPLYEKGFWSGVKPKKDASEVLQMLKYKGYNIHICTSSDYRTLPNKMDSFFHDWFPFLSWEHLIVTQNKHLIKGDIMIDDNPNNLSSDRPKNILFNAYHNLNFRAGEFGFERVNSWVDVYKVVELFAKARRDKEYCELISSLMKGGD